MIQDCSIIMAILGEPLEETLSRYAVSKVDMHSELITAKTKNKATIKNEFFILLFINISPYELSIFYSLF